MEQEKQNKAHESQKEAYYGVGGFIFEVVKVFFWALVIIMPIRIFLFQPFFVQGASMEPNFDDGDYLIVNELGYKKTDIGVEGFKITSVTPFKELQRGDVVVFKYPKNPKQYFIKRVVGLPGEQIKIEEGRIVIFNKEYPEGKLLDEEEYLSNDISTSPSSSRTLKDDEYFVLGDNRQFSHDSRAWGAVNKDEIVGKVLLRAWPLGKAQLF
jgi:signal peptidase I